MLTFVTVVFEPEVALLALQARAFSREGDESSLHEFVIIDNTDTGLGARTRGRIRGEYGRFSGRVRFVRPDDLVPVIGATGWTTQQILKLVVADVVETDWYVALDAKNVAIRPVAQEVFFSEDGRAKMGRHSYIGHPLESRVRRTLEFAGLSTSAMEEFPVTHTPFVFRTDRVRALMSELSGDRAQFARLFSREQLLEFPLYSAWSMKRGALDELYSREPLQTPALWPGRCTSSDVAAFGAELRARREAVFVALHRRALARMDGSARDGLAHVLAENALFDRPTQAARFLRRYRATFLAASAGVALRRRLRRGS